MQNMTELFAVFTALTTVSIEARFPFGSGEKNTRIEELPTLMGFDHAAPFAVSPIVGFACSGFLAGGVKLRKLR
jgi:hypothetical protein